MREMGVRETRKVCTSLDRCCPPAKELIVFILLS